MRALTVPILVLLAAACGGENLTPPGREPAPVVYDCLPNLDGRIDAGELPMVAGVPLDYAVASAVPVDVAGRADGAVRLWDWSFGAPDEAALTVAAAPLRGRWYEADFPAGEVTAPVDAAARLEGIYREDDAALWLLGVASRESNPEGGRTLLVYDRPIALYRFPLEPGARWSTTAAVLDGSVAAGLPYHGEDTYEVEVAATGRLRLEGATFTQVHAVHTRVTVHPDLGDPVVQQQVSFLFECFGEVARATGRVGDDDPEFTEASEVRRLTLEP